MNIGDLVTLSAQGKKGQQNHDVVGLFGMIVEIHHNNKHPYKIQWVGGRKRLTSGNQPHQLPMSRYEIKRYKVEK